MIVVVLAVRSTLRALLLPLACRQNSSASLTSKMSRTSALLLRSLSQRRATSRSICAAAGRKRLAERHYSNRPDHFRRHDARLGRHRDIGAAARVSAVGKDARHLLDCVSHAARNRSPSGTGSRSSGGRTIHGCRSGSGFKTTPHPVISMVDPEGVNSALDTTARHQRTISSATLRKALHP